VIHPRPELSKVRPVPHGGTVEPGVLDFSANLNPFGPSPTVRAAVRATAWHTYPDVDSTELREVIARRHGVHVGEVLIGNGCSELIDLVCRAFVRPGDAVGVWGGTYGEYERSAALAGATIETLPDRHDPTARLLFVCNPDNPTGRCLPVPVVNRQADRSPDTLVVVDEAYAECVPGFESVIACERPNVLVLRSLTKAHGLAGLRVGYAVSSIPVIEPMRRVRVPWAVNAVAQVAAVTAVRDEEYTRRTVAAWLGLRDELVAGLRDNGLSPVVAATPFFLLPNPPDEPWGVRLARHGIAVRDCTSFGIPGFARVSPRLGPDNARLLAAVREELRRS
jgi:histidinol-phosphate aminotransferase